MRRTAAAALALLAASGAQAQEFSRFLQCEGTFSTEHKTVPAHLDLALRFANRTALVQRSNLLPVGERLHYTPTPATYSMTYRLAAQGTTLVAIPGWLRSTVLVLLPDLLRLNQVRLSIDRQSGELQGQLLNEREHSLGALTMQCRSRSAEEVGPPKV